MNDKNTKKLFRTFKFLKKKELKSGFECPDAWLSVVSNMLQSLSSSMPDGFSISKIEDKYGELKVHTKGGNNTTRFIIEAAQEEALDTCDSCGNKKELQLCEKCKDEDVGTYVPDIKESITPVVQAEDDPIALQVQIQLHKR